jgi:hypothetical protein
MKKSCGVISAFVLVAISTVSCAQSFDKRGGNFSAPAGPELRWKVETGG